MYDDFTRGDSSRPQAGEQLEHSAVSLSCDTFCKNLNHILWERLNTRILEKDSILSSRLAISSFNPCIYYTLHGTCRHGLSHSSSHDLDSSWFNRRVQFHLQQLMILDNLHAFGGTNFPERMKSQRSVIAHNLLEIWS